MAGQAVSTLPTSCLIRGLLGAERAAERVRELEESRALAVDDAAARLRRVERDLHDGAQVRLAALAMKLGRPGRSSATAGSPTTWSAPNCIDAAHRIAKEALADLRDLARGIHPPALDSGLAVALETLAAAAPLPGDGAPPTIAGRGPSPAIETIAYFSVAELLANATKHSSADQIVISRRSPLGAGAMRLRGQRRRARRRGRRPGHRPGRAGPARLRGGRPPRRVQPRRRPYGGRPSSCPCGR